MVILSYLLADLVVLGLLIRHLSEAEGSREVSLILRYIAVIIAILGFIRLRVLFSTDGFIINSIPQAMIALSPEILFICVLFVQYLLKKASLIPSVLNKNELIRWIIK